MLSYEMEARRGYLYFTLMGELTLADAQSCYSAALQQTAREQAQRILIDVTRVHGDWQAAHRLAFGAFMADEHRRTGQWPQVAILAAAPIMDQGHFTQTVANNRGVHLRTSDSLQELLSWLGV